MDEPESTKPAADGVDDDDLSVSALEPVDARLYHGGALMGLRSLRRVWRVSGAVAFGALAIIVVVTLAPHIPRPAPPRIVPPHTTLQAPDNLSRCLRGASWSHDGRQIATVISYSCSSPYLGPSTFQDNVLIFDAATGRQVAAVMVDNAVSESLAQVGIVTSTSTVYAVDYAATAWSPDDRTLAVMFSVYGENVADSGMALVTLTGVTRGQISVMLNAPDASGGQLQNGFSVIPAERWEPSVQRHSTIYLAPALAYRWLPGDVLVADEPLPQSGATPTPAESATSPGDPIGGQSFSMWRTGAISPVNATSCGDNGAIIQPLATPYAALVLDTLVWSPDDRYLLDATVQARLPMRAAGPKALQSGANPCVSGLSPDQVPSAPMHDRGLRSALDLLDPHGGDQLTLAWSPDGKRLAVAVYAFPQGSSSVFVYDCASGTVINHFTGDQFEPAPAVYARTQDPIWSPDGRRLLLTVGGAAPKLVILGPESLGV